MHCSTKKEDYPKYFITPTYMLAFVAPDKMYKIEPRGTNKNEGIAIDHYITRRMVRHYWRDYYRAKQVDAFTFKAKLNALFSTYVDKITTH
jgi:hypothetical protein